MRTRSHLYLFVIISLCIAGCSLGNTERRSSVTQADCTSADPTLKPYFDPGGRYCLLYPAQFTIGDEAAGRVGFYGPPLDQTIEPVRGALLVMAEGSTGGRTLMQVVDDFVPREAHAASPQMRETSTLGGQPAEIVKGAFGERGVVAWQVFVVHENTVYHLSLYPMDDRFAQAKPDVEAIWQAVQRSFTFLSR